MKTIMRTAMLLAALAWLAGCAHNRVAATETQVASCDAGTATLKGQHDHGIAHRACVSAKVRQGLTD